MSTIMRAAKATASCHIPPRKNVADCSATPYRRPPTIAPGMLPNPPRMIMANALMVGKAPK